MSQQPSVADIFRRAQALRREHSDWPYKQVGEQLVKEFSGGPLPSLHNLTIPEQDDRAPEEDWTAGLPIVRRGIQFEDWQEIAGGIILSLEQTENYERARGAEGDRDEWHNRNVGIEDAVAKGVGKWMPEELLAMAEKEGKK
ncbi:MAG TPA: hypothetical protein VL907_12720 [Pyrinomonadaceae bacterium]|jgi:hypothetical protein|nr:hypothetical protein [Pyrinomonadaceae bacterium]